MAISRPRDPGSPPPIDSGRALAARTWSPQGQCPYPPSPCPRAPQDNGHAPATGPRNTQGQWPCPSQPGDIHHFTQPPSRAWPRRSQEEGGQELESALCRLPGSPRAHPPRASSFVINKAQTDGLLISRSRWVLLGRQGTGSLLETLDENQQIQKHPAPARRHCPRLN